MLAKIKEFFKDYSKVRLILSGTQIVFSLIVLITSAAWINVWPWPPVNFALFVGLTSFILSIALFVTEWKKVEERAWLLIALALLIVFEIFWFSAACATAAYVADVNTWPDYEGVDCSKQAIYGISVCEPSGRKNALRTCCAFCWFTWALYTASLVLFILEHVKEKKLLNPPPKPTPAPSASPSKSLKNGTIIPAQSMKKKSYASMKQSQSLKASGSMKPAKTVEPYPIVTKV